MKCKTIVKDSPDFFCVLLLPHGKGYEPLGRGRHSVSDKRKEENHPGNKVINTEISLSKCQQYIAGGKQRQCHNRQKADIAYHCVYGYSFIVSHLDCVCQKCKAFSRQYLFSSSSVLSMLTDLASG